MQRFSLAMSLPVKTSDNTLQYFGNERPISGHGICFFGKVTNFLNKNERTHRDGIPKKQPNKGGMIPQYPYGLLSLYLLPFLQLGLIIRKY